MLSLRTAKTPVASWWWSNESGGVLSLMSSSFIWFIFPEALPRTFASHITHKKGALLVNSSFQTQCDASFNCFFLQAALDKLSVQHFTVIAPNWHSTTGMIDIGQSFPSSSTFTVLALPWAGGTPFNVPAFCRRDCQKLLEVHSHRDPTWWVPSYSTAFSSPDS